jgi:hypothetical protein
MPLCDLVRGSAGALGAVLATWVLLLCLAESRPRFGGTERGVAWMSLKGHAAQFGPVWTPLLFYGAPNACLGYVLGSRLTTRRAAGYALAGASLAVAVGWLLGSPLPHEYGRAGENTVWLLGLFGALLGGCAGTLLAERRARRGPQHAE